MAMVTYYSNHKNVINSNAYPDGQTNHLLQIFIFHVQ